MTAGVALAHDYLTQHGGAERVAMHIADAFPGSPMYTTLYNSDTTFPEFADLDLRTSRLDRVGLFRKNHRLALPYIASAVDAQRIDAEVLVTSSTGWAHGYRGARRTIVYCHAPARWLYQRERYLSGKADAGIGTRARTALTGAALGALSPGLRRWDVAAAHRADRYLVNSTVTKRAVAEVYGLDADVVPPPPALLPSGDERAVPEVKPGFLLCVARLLPYKNVDVVIKTAQRLGTALVIVGEGPDRGRLESIAAGAAHGGRPRRQDSDRGAVRFLGRVDDPQLRWLYRRCSALVAASYEDYGLSPLEAGAFGRPSVVLRDGGYLDTVVDDVTGIFFDTPDPDRMAVAIDRALGHRWNGEAIAAHVAGFGASRFRAKLLEVVGEHHSVS